MVAGEDLIFFDNPDDWELAVNINRTATIINENSHTPIPSIDLGFVFKENYVAAVAGTTQGRNTWYFAGDITQVFDFAKGGNNSVLGKIQSSPKRLYINQLQLLNTPKISPDSFKLRYSPPYWFKDCTIRVYKYTGAPLNFVEDTLFDIGNALGLGSSTEPSPLTLQLQTIEALVNDRFQEINDRLDEFVDEDTKTREDLLLQINQIDAGIFTAIEGIALLLPTANSDELKNQAINRLDLDLGFL